MSGAHAALFLLLAINLFNYIDRQVLAALEPDIRATFFATGDVNAMTKTGLLGDAFFVTYMVSAPILGLLADRFSRWIIIGSAVILWSLASGGSGLAATFAILFATRILRWNWRGRLRTRSAHDLIRSFPDRKAGADHGDFLRSDSSWQRTRLCDRWTDRRSLRLALGILSLLLHRACCSVCCVSGNGTLASLRTIWYKSHRAGASVTT